jgi:hypothetical protein
MCLLSNSLPQPNKPCQMQMRLEREAGVKAEAVVRRCGPAWPWGRFRLWGERLHSSLGVSQP